MPGVKQKSGGKRPNAGRKSKAQEIGLAALLEKCFTPKDREEVIKKLVEDAKSDDPKICSQARQLLLAYTFGKPKEQADNLDYTPSDLDALDDYELELFINGHDPRPLFAAARRRAAKEAAEASRKRT